MYNGTKRKWSRDEMTEREAMFLLVFLGVVLASIVVTAFLFHSEWFPLLISFGILYGVFSIYYIKAVRYKSDLEKVTKWLGDGKWHRIKWRPAFVPVERPHYKAEYYIRQNPHRRSKVEMRVIKTYSYENEKIIRIKRRTKWFSYQKCKRKVRKIA